MSALAARVSTAAKAVVGRLKAVFKARPYHWHLKEGRAMSREEVVARYANSNWAGRALSAHKHRVTSGNAQAAWLEFIDFHSKHSNIVAERKMDWSPVLLARDAAAECGLSEEAMRQACEQCVALGFTPRKGEEGADFYRFRLDMKVIAAAKNYSEPRNLYPREGSGFGRKPVASEEGVDKAKGQLQSAVYQETRPTPIAPILLPAGQKVSSKDLALDLHNHTKLPLRIEGKTTLAGKTRLDFFSHSLGEAQAETQSGASPSVGRMDAGLSKIVGVIGAVDGPPPNHPILPFATDPLAVGLARLGVACTDTILDQVRGIQRCDTGFLLEWVERCLRKAEERKTIITDVMLPKLTEQANQQWKNGGAVVWAERHEPSNGAIEDAPAPEVNAAPTHSVEDLRHQLKEAKARGAAKPYLDALKNAIAAAEKLHRTGE